MSSLTDRAIAARAEAMIAGLLAAAAQGDAAVLAARPGIAAAVTRRARALLAQRPAERATIIAAYLAGLGHPSPRVRFECAHALDAFGDLSTRAALADLIDDPVPRVRRM